MASSLASVPGITATTGADSTRAVTTVAATMAGLIMGAAATTAEAIMGDRATDPTDAALPIVPGRHIAVEDREDSRVGTASTVAADSAAAEVADSMAEADFMVAEATAADTAKA